MEDELKNGTNDLMTEFTWSGKSVADDILYTKEMHISAEKIHDINKDSEITLDSVKKILAALAKIKT